MATRPLPDPESAGIEYVPYEEDDDAQAIAPLQALRPTLVTKPAQPSGTQNPMHAPVLQFPQKPTPAAASWRALLTMAICVVLLVSFLVLVVHSHIPQASRVSHPAVLDTGAMHPAKPSPYGEAFTPASPARKPRTRITVAPTPPPADSSEAASQ